MSTRDNNTLSEDKFAELRRRALARLGSHQNKIPVMQQEDIKKLVHELDTSHIELELQNEDLRLAQAELEKSRNKYSGLYEFAPVGYLTMNDKGMILEANLTAAEMLGVERRALFNKPLSAFIFEEDQDIYYRHRKKILEEKRSSICDLRLRDKGGKLLWVQMKSSISVDLKKSSGQLWTILTDISERKVFEETLQCSKTEWEKTFDSISDIITLQDKDFCIIRANKAAYQVLHVEYGGLNGKHCYEVFRGETKPCLDCPVLLTLDDYQTHSAQIIHENLGKIFHVTSSPFLDENGEFSHIVYIAKDITEQKKMEEKLFQAHKLEAIGTLAGGIAHDFNNILSAIIGYAELAKLDLPENSRAGKKIDQVISSGMRAADLVRQILAFSRKTGSQRQPFQPHLIVKEALKMLRASLPTTLSMEEHIDTECGSILADPTQIHQIVVNLCTNAYHAMEDEKGTLTITLCRKEIREEDIVEGDVSPGPFIVLSIRDTGHGMDKKTMERIFEPYFTTKDVGKGSGLGLAVIYGIVKSYKGFIQVESELGKGTTFHVCIPALEEDYSTFAKTEKNDAPTGTERILLVDDESLIINLNTSILERLGYKVTATTNSQEALEKIRTHPDDFDLVITDQTMPKLSGVELAQEILKTNPDMPIILCSGYSSVITEEGALAIGIKKYAEKPVDRRTLSTIVRQVLDDNKV